MCKLLKKSHPSILRIYLVLNWLVFKCFIVSLMILFYWGLRTFRSLSCIVLAFVIFDFLINLDFSFYVFNLYILALFIYRLLFYQLSQASLRFILLNCHKHFLKKYLTFLFARYYLIVILGINLILIKLDRCILILLLIDVIFIRRK